jgi:hypothetical protein
MGWKIEATPQIGFFQRNHQLLFILQQSIKTSERPEGGGWLLPVSRQRFIIPFLIQIPRVLIVVTVKTQQFPIAAVRRIVIVVVILVMDRELTKSLACEFAPASCTDPRIHLECLLPIGFLPTPSLGNDLIHLVFV